MAGLVGGVGLLPRRRGGGGRGRRGGPLRHDDPAAQRHRLAAPGPRAHHGDRGLPDEVAPHERAPVPVAAGHRPRRHRHAGGGGEEAQEGAQHHAPRPGPRGLHLRGVEVEGVVRQPHHDAAAAPGRVGRLEPRGIHDGRQLVGGRQGGLRAPHRGGPHLPRHAPGELVVHAQDGHLGHRGGLHRPGGQDDDVRAGPRAPVRVRHAHLVRLQGGRLRRGDRRRDHASGDDAGRHGRRGAPGRPAVHAPARQDAGAPLQRPQDPHRVRRRAGRYVLRLGRRQDHAGARPQRFCVRPPSRPARDHHLHGHGRDQRERRAVHGRDAVRRALPDQEAAGGDGPAARRREQQDAHPDLQPQRRRHRAAAQAAVVGELPVDGQGGGGRRARRFAQDRAGLPRGHLVPLAGQHPRLVHQPAAVVGPPRARVLRHHQGPRGRGRPQQRRLLGRGARRGRGATHGRRALWRGRGGHHARAGRGRAGHVVQLGAVPLQHRRVAGHGAPRLQGLLPGHAARDGPRHPLLLGGAHGHDGAQALRRAALQDGVPARHGARQVRPQDEQVAGQRDRPDGGHLRLPAGRPAREARPGQPAAEGGREGQEGPVARLPRRHPRVRRRRHALRPAGVHGAGPRRQPRHQPRRRLPPVLQQAVERDQVRAQELRRRRRLRARHGPARHHRAPRGAPRAPAGARLVDPVAPGVRRR
mmetsp:Transcript_19217/g.67846  ORF Transcript_19217/g.67846 Transcript_19217/m.67846 type:complete len:696 (+) Transcript_19217:602-2689(+)